MLWQSFGGNFKLQNTIRTTFTKCKGSFVTQNQSVEGGNIPKNVCSEFSSSVTTPQLPSIFFSFYLYMSRYFFIFLPLYHLPSLLPCICPSFCFVFCPVYFGPQKNDLCVVILKFVRHIFPLQHAIPVQVVLPFKNDTSLKHC